MSAAFASSIARFALAVGAGLALAVATVSCGGGGGGGGGSSDTGNGNTTNSNVASSGAGFPIGVSLHAPLEASSQTNGALAIEGTSDTTTALAEGRVTLSASLVSTEALFNTGVLSHAACYGPAIAYAQHDDASSSASASGTLPQGNVAMWSDLNGSGASATACSAAEMDAQLVPLARQMRQALYLAAALRKAVSTSSTGRLPDPGTSLDLTASVASPWAAILNDVSVSSATVSAVSDSTQYVYRIVLATGSGASAQRLEIKVLHTPNDINEHYSGVALLTHSRLTSDAAWGCADTRDASTGLYRVAHVASLGYNRYDQALQIRLRSGQFCGGASSTSSDHFADVATADVESGEINPAIALDASGNRGGTKGWKRELVRYSGDVDLLTFDGDFAHGWQNTPQDTHGRLFLVHQSRASGTQQALVFHGMSGPLGTADATLLGLACNWSGPGASHTTLPAYFQSQSLTLPASGQVWSVSASALRYAPTNSCQASSTMRFDVNADGVLGATEGQGVTYQLDQPTGGRTDVQSEVVERGYWPPTLF